MQNREALIGLNMVHGLGAGSIRLLAEHFGPVERVFEASEEEVRRTLGPRYGTAEVVAGIRAMANGKAAAREVSRAAEIGAEIMTLADPGYPRLLKEIHQPPPVLYLKGALLPEDEAAVAIVGTRSASPYGLTNARWFGEELARCGVTVVSGLAEGIDRQAHEGALEGRGRTIAVVGHGLSMVYPPQHRELADRVARSGCLLSEFPIWMQPVPMNFPRRNRVIAGLSLGTLVVEAPAKSGALITAREAMEQGREVFAMPGPISSPQSRGTHGLLRDGAKMVCQVQDILEELAPQMQRIIRASTGSARTVSSGHPEPFDVAQDRLVEADRLRLTSEESKVFNAVPVGSGVGVESIARATALQPARLMSVLTGLELKGLVRQTVGRGFARER